MNENVMIEELQERYEKYGEYAIFSNGELVGFGKETGEE